MNYKVIQKDINEILRIVIGYIEIYEKNLYSFIWKIYFLGQLVEKLDRK